MGEEGVVEERAIAQQHDRGHPQIKGARTARGPISAFSPPSIPFRCHASHNAVCHGKCVPIPGGQGSAGEVQGSTILLGKPTPTGAGEGRGDAT